MHCPRLKHFARLNFDGTVARCGHMSNYPTFKTYEDLENSDWNKEKQHQMDKDIWPQECERCKTTEELNQTSIRKNTIQRHDLLKYYKSDYLIVGGVLDNVCNNACISCNENLSTTIGYLKNAQVKLNNIEKFFNLPQERIVELDLNGGEPTTSPNYKKILENLPASVKFVRINSNGSKYFDLIETLLEKKIKVILTLSIDGVDKIFEYTRFPIKWHTFEDVVDQYVKLRSNSKYLLIDFWTTLSALNVFDIDNIIEFADSKNIPHQYSPLVTPKSISIRKTNAITRRALTILNPDKHSNLLQMIATEEDNTEEIQNFLNHQDSLRKIHRQDFDIYYDV